MSEMTCIVCPIGCQLMIDDEGNITQNKCPRGVKYAETELTNPTRMVTTTVRTTSLKIPRISVKTNIPISKTLVFETMKKLDHICVNHSTKVGDILIQNIFNSGVDIIATKEVSFE